jgi:hypothetical protein
MSFRRFRNYVPERGDRFAGLRAWHAVRVLSGPPRSPVRAESGRAPVPMPLSSLTKLAGRRLG